MQPDHERPLLLPAAAAQGTAAACAAGAWAISRTAPAASPLLRPAHLGPACLPCTASHPTPPHCAGQACAAVCGAPHLDLQRHGWQAGPHARHGALGRPSCLLRRPRRLLCDGRPLGPAPGAQGVRPARGCAGLPLPLRNGWLGWLPARPTWRSPLLLPACVQTPPGINTWNENEDLISFHLASIHSQLQQAYVGMALAVAAGRAFILPQARPAPWADMSAGAGPRDAGAGLQGCRVLVGQPQRCRPLRTPPASHSTP